MNAQLEVVLEYRLRGEEQWRQFPITLSDYLDPDYADDEPVDIDSVELHAHAVDYLDIAPSLIENTRLTLRNNRTSEKRIIVETFWSGGDSRIIERRDEHDGSEKYWEMIVDSQLQKEPIITQIIRIGRKNGVLVLYSQSIIRMNADGSQTELVNKTGNSVT
jgi:hypothetical protein